MKCKDCKDFCIVAEPIRDDVGVWDLGMARCEKYNMVVDFIDHRKLNKLECVRGEQDDGKGND